jgi:hypothetical protein
MGAAMTTGERRQSVRISANEGHGITRARVRPGHEVDLVDVSSGGALIEAAHRLLPGSTIDLQLVIRENQVAVRGRVLRCAVARLRAATVFYRGAIGFDRSLPWLANDRRAEPGWTPGDDMHARHACRASGSRSFPG